MCEESTRVRPYQVAWDRLVATGLPHDTATMAAWRRLLVHCGGTDAAMDRLAAARQPRRPLTLTLGGDR